MMASALAREGGWRNWFMMAVPALLVLALFMLRRHVVMVPLESELVCSGCLVDRQWLADGPFLAGILLVASASLLRMAWPIRILLRTLVAAAVLVYVADVFIYANFYVRLQIRDVVLYGTHPGLVLSQFKQTLDYWQLIGLACLGVLAALLVLVDWPRRGVMRPRLLMAVASACVVVAVVANARWNPTFPSTWVVRNIVAHNVQKGVATPYAPGQVETLRHAMLTAPLRCLSGTPSQPSIVLLITESWSPYQSKLFSGLNDWTPRLDKLASESRYFTNFHAGGENTNAGLVSILMGLDMYSPVKDSLSLAPFEGLWQVRSSMPKQFSALGYQTVFMTNGALSFSNKGEWLHDIGFQEVDGDDAPEYQGAPRLAFNAAPDEYLYRKALSFVASHRGQPFLLVIENVSTHHPYTHPFSQIRSEPAVFHYLDQTVTHLHQQLREQGFLADNLFMVVSDHRAMTRLWPGEEHRLGASAPARIPAFVSSDRIAPGREDAPLQQSDILPSLVNLVSGSACSRKDIADIFAPKVPSDRCLLHAPNSDWNVIKAYCGARNYTIKLDGSQSTVAADDGGPVPNPQAMLQGIATRRLFTGYSRLLPPPTVMASAPAAATPSTPAASQPGTSAP